MVSERTLSVHPGRRTPTAAMRGWASRPSKVSYEQAEAIRAAYATGKYTQWQLGDAYGISQPSVHHIVRGWTHRSAAERRMAAAPVLTPAERIERWTAAVNAAPSPLMDAKQAEIERRNAEDEMRGWSAFSDGAR